MLLSINYLFFDFLNKDSMNKNILVNTKLKQMAGAAGLLLALLGHAGTASAQGLPSAQEAPAERGLPAIVSNQSDRGQLTRPISAPARTTQVAAARDSFETYVEAVTGTSLGLFGKNLFSNVPTTFAPFDAAQVNADYVIGTGDALQIRGWGMVNIDVNVTVDRSGAIYIPSVGSVNVAGVKYRDLQSYLKKAVSKNFSNFELTASIAQTRSVQIYVVGHAVRPGTYTLNAMSTLLNALFTSGGPDGSGSMRNIQLKRGTDNVTTFDLYDMLTKGDKSRDVPLRDGDVIYIPEVGPLMALTGNVKTPAIFELKGSTTLAEIVVLAGGVDSSSQQRKIIVEKTVNNIYQTVAELDGEKSAIERQLGAIPVKATDVIRVFTPSAVGVQAQVQHEYVRVSGEVRQTGIFELNKGETLRELVARLGGANENGYIYAMQLKRDSVRRQQQIKLDEMAERFERDLESAASKRLSNISDKDAVALEQNEIERQRRIAQKLRTVKAEGRIVLELENGNAQVKNLPDLPLQDGDSIFIPRKPGTVEVIGSVFQANSFIYKSQRNVGDYLNMAGGPTVSADKSEMYVIRADGTAESGRSKGWFSGISGSAINPGDTVVVPESIERSTWKQSIKEWTTIFYQFGLGAAGLKVLKD